MPSCAFAGSLDLLRSTSDVCICHGLLLILALHTTRTGSALVLHAVDVHSGLQQFMPRMYARARMIHTFTHTHTYMHARTCTHAHTNSHPQVHLALSSPRPQHSLWALHPSASCTRPASLGRQVGVWAPSLHSPTHAHTHMRLSAFITCTLVQHPQVQDPRPSIHPCFCKPKSRPCSRGAAARPHEESRPSPSPCCPSTPALPHTMQVQAPARPPLPHPPQVQVQTAFVRAESWGLGPLTILQPIFMTMALDGLVRGGPADGEVIGITGYDIFRWAEGVRGSWPCRHCLFCHHCVHLAAQAGKVCAVRVGIGIRS